MVLGIWNQHFLLNSVCGPLDQGYESDPLLGDGVVEDRGAGDGGECLSCLISLLPTRIMSGCVLIK